MSTKTKTLVAQGKVIPLEMLPDEIIRRLYEEIDDLDAGDSFSIEFKMEKTNDSVEEDQEDSETPDTTE